MTVWRIQSNTSKLNIAEYCINNHIAAMGWSLLEYEGETSDLQFDTFEEYCELAENYYGNDSSYYSNLYRFVKELKKNDIIWIRNNGIYYCARITEKTKWHFDNSNTARNYDACNTITNVDWIKIGDEGEVPSALTTAFIRGKTLQKINKEGVIKYSQIIYNQKSNDDFKYNINIELNQDTFYNLISPSDCEDLLYFWLYSKHNNYACIPSTNKIATQKYEFVIMDTEMGKHIYIQVKNGNVDIDADDYASLVEETNNEVYLLSTKGKIKHIEKYNNIHSVDAKTLFEFACDEANKNYIPPNIDYWMQFAGGTANGTEFKGIMIDTNNDECERYMLNRGVIAAWGTPKKYIQSFNKNDIALFYKKKYGIIAMGKILSGNIIKIENGYEMEIEWLVKAKIDQRDGEYVSIYPSTIKNELHKSFYFASTRKVPFLSLQESERIAKLLKEAQEN